jgi:hypothetical protein
MLLIRPGWRQTARGPMQTSPARHFWEPRRSVGHDSVADRSPHRHNTQRTVSPRRAANHPRGRNQPRPGCLGLDRMARPFRGPAAWTAVRVYFRPNRTARRTSNPPPRAGLTPTTAAARTPEPPRRSWVNGNQDSGCSGCSPRSWQPPAPGPPSNRPAPTRPLTARRADPCWPPHRTPGRHAPGGRQDRGRPALCPGPIRSRSRTDARGRRATGRRVAHSCSTTHSSSAG